MPEWPATPNLIGKRIPRLDGLLKASGKAKYPSDERPDGTLDEEICSQIDDSPCAGS